MTKKTTELSAGLPEHLRLTQDEANKQGPNTGRKYPEIRVYNKQPGGKTDKDLAGQMFLGSPSDGNVFAPCKGTILLVRKSFYGFPPNGVGKNDYYYSNMLGIFETGPVFIRGVKTIDENTKIPEQFRFDTVKDARGYLGEKEEDGNRFFEKMQTPMGGGKEYVISYVRNHYHVFFLASDTKKVYEIDPKSSYGNFNNVEPLTIEGLKEECLDLLIKSGEENPKVEFSMFDVNLGVREEEGFYKFSWKLVDFCNTEDFKIVNEKAAEVRAYVDELNKGILEGGAEKKEKLPEAPKEALKDPEKPTDPDAKPVEKKKEALPWDDKPKEEPKK